MIFSSTGNCSRDQWSARSSESREGSHFSTSFSRGICRSDHQQTGITKTIKRTTQRLRRWPQKSRFSKKCVIRPLPPNSAGAAIQSILEPMGKSTVSQQRHNQPPKSVFAILSAKAILRIDRCSTGRFGGVPKDILTDYFLRRTIPASIVRQSSSTCFDSQHLKLLSSLRPLIAKRFDKSRLNKINSRRSGGSTGCDQHALPAFRLFSDDAGSG